ncbi:BapA/Bap/LapF family prefix-like domain-containing protein, partial [Ralstonia pseudosolanacearum]|uniref:BapA/Bap/LapF family prefix-like domain-containing protein n=1 Tax=Ralstonia pseudosolanacearum TaxID=1310165 RepID=UPI003D2C5126
MTKLRVIDANTGTLIAEGSNRVTVKPPSIVQIDIQSRDVRASHRAGNDMVIELASGETVIVENFYATQPSGQGNELVFSGGGELWRATPSADASTFELTDLSKLDPEAGGKGAGAGVNLLWPLSILGLVGAAIAIADNSGGSGHSGSSANKTPPTATDSSNVNTAGTTSASSAATSSPATSSSTPAPDHLTLAADGKSVSGTGTPQDTIIVRDGNGNELGRGTVGDDGHFNVQIPAQPPGQKLSVVANHEGMDSSASPLETHALT